MNTTSPPSSADLTKERERLWRRCYEYLVDHRPGAVYFPIFTDRIIIRLNRGEMFELEFSLVRKSVGWMCIEAIREEDVARHHAILDEYSVPSDVGLDS